MEKLVVIWDSDETLRFMVVSAAEFDGFHGVYINTYTTVKSEKEKQNRLSDLVYDEDGNYRHPVFADFPTEAVRAGAAVIVCGFLP